MKIATILDHIDSGHMALPEFQRGYVWNRNQVRSLFESLYWRHPVGGLLVWATDSTEAQYRGEGLLAPGVVKLLLDGQQRMTSLYGVVRGKAPKFFEGNSRAFSDLRFDLESETFSFYQAIKMKDDPRWIDVTELMREGVDGLGEFTTRCAQEPELAPRLGVLVGRLSQLLGIKDIDLHIDEITGTEKTIEVVVDIFNRVNSGGTKLSKGDLALAKICADWPDARQRMRDKLGQLRTSGYSFKLDWLLRSVNTVLTGEAKFHFLHDRSADEVQDGLRRASQHIDTSLNLISGRLGLDHDRVLFARNAIPVMVRYLDQHEGQLTESERDKLLFWFIQAGMWGRFSGSTETYIDADIEALSGGTGALDQLLDKLRLWHGSLSVQPGHFTGWSRGARLYPVLYLLTRMGSAQDWGNGLALKAGMLGKMNKLEVHHIFPKSRLYRAGFSKPQVNALANFCFQTKATNLNIGNRLPEEYFPEIENRHPGALASQWIPMEPALWSIENYEEFMEARKCLLADEANRLLADLLHGETHWLDGTALPQETDEAEVLGGISDQDEEAKLLEINDWMRTRGLPAGLISHEHVDPENGQQVALFDLAWPEGVQTELTQPVAVLLNEPRQILEVASRAGFRCFTTGDDFRAYVLGEILAETTDHGVIWPSSTLPNPAIASGLRSEAVD
jgi:hypothetical protein